MLTLALPLLLADAPLPVEVVSPQPVWLSLLVSAFPVVLGLVVAAHPLLKLSQFLATKHGSSKAANAGLTVAEHLAASADKYLEESQHNIGDIVDDPAKRAAALKALADRAKAEVPGAVADATSAFGASYLDGKVSAALDNAEAKQNALAAGGQSPS